MCKTYKDIYMYINLCICHFQGLMLTLAVLSEYLLIFAPCNQQYYVLDKLTALRCCEKRTYYIYYDFELFFFSRWKLCRIDTSYIAYIVHTNMKCFAFSFSLATCNLLVQCCKLNPHLHPSPCFIMNVLIIFEVCSISMIVLS